MKKSTLIILIILAVFLILGAIFTVIWFSNHPTIEVTLDANGGSAENKTVEVRYGGEYSLPIPVRKDYDFYGWYLGNAKIDTMGERWSIDHDVTLVAKWKIVAENEIVYSAAEGGLAVSDYYGDNLKDIVIPTKFAGKNIVSLGGDFEILNGKLSQNGIDRVTFYVPSSCKVGDLSALKVKYDIVKFDYTENEIFYAKNGDSYSLSGYIGEPIKVINIPTEIMGKPVTSIADGAFNSLIAKYKTSELSAMKVYVSSACAFAQDLFASEKPVHAIIYTFKNHDFYFIDKGTHLGIAEYIGNYKSNVIVPDTYEGKPVTEIGAYAFYGASSRLDHSSSDFMNFTTVFVPTSIDTIGTGAFGECGGLKVSLYEKTDKDTIREIINVPFILYEWYPNVKMGTNPDLVDVITQIRPAFGWTKYTNATYYAKLNLDGGVAIVNGNEVDYLALKRNKAYSLPTPTKEGYTFAGWYCDTKPVAMEGEMWIYSTHVELTAKWTEN